MSVAFLMHVCDSADYLLKDAFAKRLVESLVGHLLDVVVDAHALTQFHDEVDMSSLIDDFVELHDVLMPKFGESINLSRDSLLGFFVL